MIGGLFAANRRARLRYQHHGTEVRQEPYADWRVQIRFAVVRVSPVVSSAHHIHVQGRTDPVQHGQIFAQQPEQPFCAPDQQFNQQVGSELFGD